MMSQNSSPAFVLRPLVPADRTAVRELIRESWGDEYVIAHGKKYHPADLPGFLAEAGGQIVGLITYCLDAEQCEVVTLDSFLPASGVGSSLMDAVSQAARSAGCRRLWLITTNDNLNALRFYQKRGLEICAVHRHAVDEARRLKPSIPLVGEHGIPLRDEIELEILL